MAMNPPQPEVLKFLLVRQEFSCIECRAEAQKETQPRGILKMGMLQQSAGSGNLPIIETLIEAGADVNQDPPNLGDIREPGPYRALWMAADAQKVQGEEKHIKTVRFLLQNGADMTLPASGRRNNKETAWEAAQRKGDSEMLALFEEFRNGDSGKSTTL